MLHMQVSVLKDVAAQFGLEPFLPVMVQRIEPRDITVDFLELTFKDQFLSRADVWRFKVAMVGKCVYVGKTVACLGVRSQVEGLLASNRELSCGVVGADTKLIVRSRSSRLFWLVQMSAEMWEFAPDGELYYEKLINRLLRVMIAKWNESSVSHSVTIIAFSRSFYDRSQFPEGYDPLAPLFSEPTRQSVGLRAGTTTSGGGCGPTIHVDPLTGRFYEDFYKVLVMNFTGPDWDHLLGVLKREFASYHESHRWRSPEEVIPAEYTIHERPQEASGRQTDLVDNQPRSEPCAGESSTAACVVNWTALPFGVPARAMDGNILEAINVTLNIFDKHYMDRDLNRTGQSIVMITAGCSIFNVDERLAQITKQRMMDNGVGMDMISLTTPPMHVVPLFICQSRAVDKESLSSPHSTAVGAAAAAAAAADVYGCESPSDTPLRQRPVSAPPASSPGSLSACDDYDLQGLEKEIREFEQNGWESEELSSADSMSNNIDARDASLREAVLREGHRQRTFSIPHWVNITFLDFDCRCRSGSSMRGSSGGGRQPPEKMSSSSPANGDEGSGRSQYNNRLLSHRAQACECQYAMNQRFLPLPPFRMFDLTAPTEKLSFPVALKNLIKGYPRKPQRPEATSVASRASSVDDGGSSQQRRRQRGLSDISDALSVHSAVVPSCQFQLCKSPDYDSSLRRTLAMAASSFIESVVSREAFQEYDDAVFSTSSIAGLHSPKQEQYRPGCSPGRFGEQQDITSATFSGDTSLADAMGVTKANKGHLFSQHGRGSASRGFGNANNSSSIIGSLLSPRNEASVYLHQQRHRGAISPSNPSPVCFKRVSTLNGLAAANAAAISIPTTSALQFASTRRDAVHPKQDLRAEDTRPSSGYRRRRRLSWNTLALTPEQQTDDSEAVDLLPPDTSSYGGEAPTTGRSLAKSMDSSRFLASRLFKEGNGDASSSMVGAMRVRPCVSNAEDSSSTSTGSALRPHGSSADSGFLHLSRSMTMKPTPSYYNDLLLRSPPPAAAVASPLPSPHALRFMNSFQNLPTPRAIRRGHSEILSPSLVSAAVQSFAHPIGPERSKPGVSTNPFKYSTETLETASERLTSDRRRWSHLFPVLTVGQQHHAAMGSNTAESHQYSHHGGDKWIHLGPNWKSLTSPAILPLTTDYYPSAKELRTSYTESFYTLTLPSMQSETVPKYNDHNELLIEMVCQRLAGDFQLVATDSCTDSDPAHHHVTGVAANRGPSGESRLPNNAVVYYLSMGHRIHQMIFDPELQTIDVKRYFQRAIQSDKNESKKYRYSLWVDATAAFHPLQQTFHEYPQPEENWNSLDHLLCGYHDEMSDLTKCRRIRFALMPPKDAEAEGSPAYAAKFAKLIDYLQTRIAPAEDGVKEKIVIRVRQAPNGASESHSQVPQQAGTLSYKICCKSSSSSSSRTKSDDTRAEWVMIRLEDALDVSRNYHLDVRWLACSGIVADEFVSALKRKCKQSGLEIRRVPEYSRVSFLQIHPLIAPIFLPVPLRARGHEDKERSLVAILVKRLDFVLDDERLADSSGIGYGLGIAREERKPLSGGFKAYKRQHRRSESSVARLLAERWRTRGYKQFMHRSLPVFVRLVSSGVVWIPSYDYDEKSDATRVDELFREICAVVHTSAALQELVESCCCTEAA